MLRSRDWAVWPVPWTHHEGEWGREFSGRWKKDFLIFTWSEEATLITLAKINLRLCFYFDVASRWIVCGCILFFFERLGLSTSFGKTSLFTLNCCFKSSHCVSSKFPVSSELIKFGLQFSVEQHCVYSFLSTHQPNRDTGSTSALLDFSKFYHNSTLAARKKNK